MAEAQRLLHRAAAAVVTVVKQQSTAGVLRPAYVLVNDRALRCVMLCIRGTHSMKDLFTSLAGVGRGTARRESLY